MGQPWPPNVFLNKSMNLLIEFFFPEGMLDRQELIQTLDRMHRVITCVCDELMYLKQPRTLK